LALAALRRRRAARSFQGSEPREIKRVCGRPPTLEVVGNGAASLSWADHHPELGVSAI
jgi:hypothetical protein